MAMAALASRGSDEELRQSQYQVLELWQQSYGGALLIMLPDTFGTTQFLEGAPEWVANWTGQRIDSKDPTLAGDEYIAMVEEAWARSAAEAADCERWTGCRGDYQAAPAFRGTDTLQRGLGDAADERFSRMSSARGRYAEPAEPGVQADERGWHSDGEAVGQSAQGGRAGGGDCTVSAGVRERGSGGGGGAGVTLRRWCADILRA